MNYFSPPPKQLQLLYSKQNKVHKRTNFWVLVIALITGLAFGTPAMSASTIGNATLTRLFVEYEQNIHSYIEKVTQQQWAESGIIAESLHKQSKHLIDLSKLSQNPVWEFYASNLTHHCTELIDANLAKDQVEIHYLIAILIDHIGQIQAVNPNWLREHIADQIQQIKEGLLRKENNRVRDAAETIHTSASKIVLSAVLARNAYKHIYWQTTIVQINRLGDTIIGEVNANNWQHIPKHLIHIEHLYGKWANSFIASTNAQALP